MPRGLWTGLEKATGNLSRTGLGLLQIQNQREHQATLEANSAARLGMAKEAGEREAKKFTAEETERLEGEKPISVETFADQVEGGVDGPQFKMLYKTVTDNGFVDMSQGGLGTFRKKDREEMLKLIGEPNYAAKLSRVSIGWWRSQKAAIGEQLKAKPEDEKLLQQRQKINLGLNQALGRDKDLQTQMAAQKDKSRTDQEFFVEDPEGYAAYKEAGRKAEEGKGITIAQKETRAQNFIKNYGATRNKFDQIIEIRPAQRIPRLNGWLRTRALEKKKGYFSDDELNQIEQTIMTDLRVEPKVQQTINLARDNGATEEEIKLMLQAYLKGQK